MWNKRLNIQTFPSNRVTIKSKYIHSSVKESHSVLSSLWPPGLYSSWNSPGQNTGVGSLSLLQGIFPTQGSNPDPQHCRQIFYQLSHKGSPRVLALELCPNNQGMRVWVEEKTSMVLVHCILWEQHQHSLEFNSARIKIFHWTNT